VLETSNDLTVSVGEHGLSFTHDDELARSMARMQKELELIQLWAEVTAMMRGPERNSILASRLLRLLDSTAKPRLGTRAQSVCRSF
jgi:hypothetical protein